MSSANPSSLEQRESFKRSFITSDLMHFDNRGLCDGCSALVDRIKQFETNVLDNFDRSNELMDDQGAQISKLTETVQHQYLVINQQGAQISKLTETVQQQDFVINQQGAQISKLTETIQHQYLGINRQDIEMNKFKVKEAVKSFQIAIRDLDKLHKLQNVMPISLRPKFELNRNLRISLCHYIDQEFDSNDVLMYKQKTLLTKLLSLKPEVNQKLTELYSADFVSQIILFLKTHLQDVGDTESPMPEVEIIVYEFWDL